MLIKGKKISICGEDKLYFPEGCWTGCPVNPNMAFTFALYDPENIHHGQYAPGEVARFIMVIKNTGEEDIKNIVTWIGSYHVQEAWWKEWDLPLLKIGEERQYFYDLTIAPDGMINYTVYAGSVGCGVDSNEPAGVEYKSLMINLRIQ